VILCLVVLVSATLAHVHHSASRQHLEEDDGLFSFSWRSRRTEAQIEAERVEKLRIEQAQRERELQKEARRRQKQMDAAQAAEAARAAEIHKMIAADVTSIAVMADRTHVLVDYLRTVKSMPHVASYCEPHFMSVGLADIRRSMNYHLRKCYGWTDIPYKGLISRETMQSYKAHVVEKRKIAKSVGVNLSPFMENCGRWAEALHYLNEILQTFYSVEFGGVYETQKGQWSKEVVDADGSLYLAFSVLQNDKEWAKVGTFPKELRHRIGHVFSGYNAEMERKQRRQGGSRSQTARSQSSRSNPYSSRSSGSGSGRRSRR